MSQDRTISRMVVGAVALLLCTGALHRGVHHFRARAAAVYRPLHAPLKELPAHLGSYVASRDIPLGAEVLQVARVDQYLYREYNDRVGDQSVQLYVGYWGQQNLGMGHGPEVCYPAVGWKADSPAAEEALSVPAAQGSDVEATVALHHFSRTGSLGVERRSVAFAAVVDGEFRSSSSGAFFHKPPDSRKCGFLAHVHVSTSVSDGDWRAADNRIVEFMGRLLPHLSSCLFGETTEFGALAANVAVGQQADGGARDRNE